MTAAPAPFPSTTAVLTHYTPLARSLARRIAWAEADQDDLLQEGLVALWLSVNGQPPPLVVSPALAKTILSRHMANYYGAGVRNRPPPVSLDETGEEESQALLLRLPCPGPAPDAEAEARLVEGYLADLAEAVGETGAWVGRNLLDPGQGLGGWVLQEMADKRERMDRGEVEVRLRGIDTARVSHRQLQEALGLTRPQWFEVLSEVRDFTRNWLAERGLPSP